MAGAGTVATMLPGANHTLRDPNVPPVALFRELGVPMAVATNANPGSSPTLSPLLMMNLACTRFWMTAEEVLAGFTREGARALGMHETHGTLEVGKAADFALWDIERPGDLAYWLGAGITCRELVKDGVVVRGG
jgi:imidazolonepropionase